MALCCYLSEDLVQVTSKFVQDVTTAALYANRGSLFFFSRSYFSQAFAVGWDILITPNKKKKIERQLRTTSPSFSSGFHVLGKKS